MFGQKEESKKGRSILVVDDDETVTQLLGDALSVQKYEVHKANNGRKGLEEARRYLPDLILMDVNMPQMDGFSALRELKKDKKTREIPVIMLTARGEEESLRKGMEGEAEIYVTKPYDLQYLLKQIEKVLAMRELRKS